ncbi:hypothetical protein [Nonomuraea rubra]|uniref:Uncharacterized protein n=1 Tax=Nonomuraea rubra TaxID=46180 RepID=A0A7X0NP80_9ACTN|nr:hypothetical protein [Nonomuraea rubra]MBB6547113.1 hypothetical protein [Nonomuraea rubra]
MTGVPRWARIAVYAIPVAVLPSSLWRLPAAFSDGMGVGERAYIVFLSVLSELVAFTAFGLVATWGERFPRWVPGLRGRRVPPPAAVIPAALGAGILTVLWTACFVAQLVRPHRNRRGDPAQQDRSSAPFTLATEP